MQEEHFLNSDFVLRRNWEFNMVDGDGEIFAWRSYDVQASVEASSDDLTEVEGDSEVVVATAAQNERMTVRFSVREPLSPILQSRIFGDGRAPTITTYDKLVRQVVRLNVPAAKELKLHVPYGVPQAHNSTVFPPTSNVLAADSGAGSLTDTTYYVWVIPVYADDDDIHGLGGAGAPEFTLANLSNYVRGFDYTLGNEGTADDVATSGGNSALAVTWTLPAGGPRPTHHMVLVGTNSSITHSSVKISAIVPYPTTNATITALGGTTFSTAPSESDLYKALRVGVSGGAREFSTDLTNQFTFDTEEASWTPIDGSSVTDGMEVAFAVWRIQTATFKQEWGGSTISEKYVTFRARNARAVGTDPDTRTASMAQVDFYEVNVAKIPRDLFSTNPDGWHGPMNFSLPVRKSRSRGCFAKFKGEHESFASLVDTYSNDITDRNVVS